MLGFTGTYRGQRVSVQGSGMGLPSLSIYAHELLREYDVDTIVRVGSCGALTERARRARPGDRVGRVHRLLR